MLRFTRDAYDEVVKRAYDGGDEEVCGLLGGEHGADESRVTDVYPAENAADARQVRYYVDPEEQLEIVESIEDAGDEVVGFYHSHPAGPTHPSETDADRATWPDLSYVICALDGYPYVGSWRWRGDEEGFQAEVVAVE